MSKITFRSVAETVRSLCFRSVDASAAGLFLACAIVTLGLGIWFLTLQDWSNPQWDRIVVIMLGPGLIGIAFLWAALTQWKNKAVQSRKENE